MKIKCERCNEYFEPTEQADFICESIKNGLPMIMVDCTLCYHHFPFHIKKYNLDAKEILCPTQGCYGSVTDINIDGENIFACGSCGNVWHSKQDLDNDITKIINQFSYRRECYVLVNNTYQNANIDMTIYEPKIIKELFVD